MIISNINIGNNVEIDTTADFNNCILGDNVRIRKYCSVFGSREHPVVIGNSTKISMMSTINGYDSQLKIGERCSISQNVHIMTGTGPSSSYKLMRLYPVIKGPVNIGNDCWIGAGSIISPNVNLGEFCIVAANSFVKHSFPPYSIIGGNPARLIRTFTEEEKAKVQADDN